jgi:hypothetical protein
MSVVTSFLKKLKKNMYNIYSYEMGEENIKNARI